MRRGLSLVTIYWIITHPRSRRYIPEVRGRYPRTVSNLDLVSEGLPRLYKSKNGAQTALTQWLKGPVGVLTTGNRVLMGHESTKMSSELILQIELESAKRNSGSLKRVHLPSASRDLIKDEMKIQPIKLVGADE